MENLRRSSDNMRFLIVPMPLGLPKAAATKVFPLAQKIGIASKKRVDSFDQVLWLTGNLDQTNLRKSVYSVRRAMQEFKPDLVYSEFNISAVIASKTEGVSVYTTVSYPTQYI